MKEKRSFQLHEKILFDIILRQAGTLSKAILEGVMNAIDAGAKECRITCNATTVTIEDDGSGIQKREHIEQWFEKFGQPHEEKEKKVFGTFRMGRGQLFAYGVNTWRTGPFRMVVDVKNQGLEYELTKMKETKPGCRISVQLYEKLMPTTMGETERTLAKWVKYAGEHLQVYWNNELISMDPSREKWDHVLEEAYVRLSSAGTLSVYNLGIHTMEIDGCRFGTGGVIVSRKQLKVNFARNDILDSCPAWRKIKPFVHQKAAAVVRQKSTLTDMERQRLADRLCEGDLLREDAHNLRLFTTVNGKHITVWDLSESDYRQQLSVCPAGHPLGDKLYMQKVAVILADETLERFHVNSAKALIKLLQKRLGDTSLDRIKIVSFAELTADMDSEYVTLDESQLALRHKLWLKLADSVKYELRLATEPSWGAPWKPGTVCASHRVLVAGKGPADGWTDGRTYVAIGVDFMDTLPFNFDGFLQLGSLLLHEFCHDAPSTSRHIHGPEFFQLFHDSVDALGLFVMRCADYFPRAVTALERKLTKQQLQLLNKTVKVADAAARISKLV